MRLIDAEFALKLAEDPDYGFESWNGNMQDVEGLLNDCPAIEAKPVVHAHWKEWYPPKEFILTGEEKLFICSNCDAKFETVENSKYCPYCGAQMDEVAGDINVGTKNGVKIPVISMEDVPKVMEEMENEHRTDRC